MSGFLSQLREARDKATPAPWIQDVCIIEGPRDADGYPAMMIYDEGGHSEDDAALICLLVNKAPEIEALIDVVRRRTGHLAACAYVLHMRPECDCGLTEHQAALRALNTLEPE